MHSMTGYGKGSVKKGNRTITLEIKSVNHRFLNFSINLPRHLLFLEEHIKKSISSNIRRGHIDVFLRYEDSSKGVFSAKLNVPLVHAYKSAIEALSRELSTEANPNIQDFLSLPEIIDVQEHISNASELILLVEQASAIALGQLKNARGFEGANIKKDLSNHLHQIDEHIKMIDQLSTLVPEKYKLKLEERLKHFEISAIDVERLSQEIVLFSERSAIDEEVSRIFSHIKQIKSLMNEEHEIGRKLDFLLQEVHREINTISAKAQDIEIVNHAVSIKLAIEKMREQAQNIE